MARGGDSTHSRGGSGRSTESATATIRSTRVGIAGKSAASSTPGTDEPDDVSCDWQFAWQALVLAALPVC